MIKTNNGNIMIALLAVGLLVGVGAWYVITQRDVVPSESTPTVTPTPEIQELTSTVDTSDWIESSYGIARPFTFKYPPTFSEILVSGGYKYQPLDGGPFILWGADSQPYRNNQTFVELADQISTIHDGTELLYSTFLTLNNHKVYFVATKTSGGKTVDYYVLVDNVPYQKGYTSNYGAGVLSLNAFHTGSSEMEYFDVFKNIISTIKIKDL